MCSHSNDSHRKKSSIFLQCVMLKSYAGDLSVSIHVNYTTINSGKFRFYILNCKIHFKKQMNTCTCKCKDMTIQSGIHSTCTCMRNSTRGIDKLQSIVYCFDREHFPWRSWSSFEVTRCRLKKSPCDCLDQNRFSLFEITNSR